MRAIASVGLLGAAVGASCTVDRHGLRAPRAEGGVDRAPDASDALEPGRDGGLHDDGSSDGRTEDPDAAGAMDATAADAGLQRRREGLVALYTFEEGTGNVVRDRSGLDPPLDLVLGDPTPPAAHWRRGAIRFDRSNILQTSGAATRLTDACRTSGEVSIEAWVEPDNETQGGPARIVTVSADPHFRNVTIGQDGSSWIARIRTSGFGDLNGMPQISTATRIVLASAPSQIVFVRETSGWARLYVNGLLVVLTTRGGDLTNWDPSFRLALGNELTNDRPWLGTFHLVAIYCDALTEADVLRHYRLGPDAE
ncbi:MAG: LamG domain-containing protein [Myxococcota bacterium]|nr:LamG domain-containing protein [Myxococcota bacterium]